MKNLFLFLFLFFTSIFLNVSFGQETEVNYADKSYYLVDSLDLFQLGEADLSLLDSCLKEYHKKPKTVNQIKALNGICNEMINNQWTKYQFFQYDLINKKLETDPELLFLNFLQKSLCNALNNIGFIKVNDGNSKLAVEYFNKSLKLSDELGIKDSKANILNSLGGIYMSQGNIELAIFNYTKALKIYERNRNDRGKAIVYNNIGDIYRIQKKYLLALEYYNKSLRITDVNNKLGVASLFNNIGYIHLYLSNSDSSLLYFEKSLKLRLELKDQHGIATTYNNMGSIFRNQNNFNKANIYLGKGLQLSKEIKDKELISISYNNIAKLKFKQGLFQQSKDYSLKGLKIAREIGFIDDIKLSANLLTQIAQKQCNYKEAFEMYQLEIQMRDSITNEKNYKAVIQQQANYEYEKKKAEDSIVNAQAKKIQLALLEAEKAKNEKKELALATEKKQKWYLYIGLGLLALFSGFMYNRFKFIKKQRSLIKEQKKEVEKSHKEIEASHKEITDSINYAERIQRSFLATKETLDENLKDYFVYFNPKEAVSGDFYWSTKLDNNNFAFTVADSTGHGVPGAIMSLLNITSLEKAVETETEPHYVLNKTREIIIKRLKKDGSEQGGKDGMDCSLMVLNKEKTELTFASANNPVIIIRNNELLEYKGDKMPVGKHNKENESFTLQKVHLQKGDVIYALTDGFQDQFGGPKGKKYMIKNLKNKFIEIANSPMTEQREILSEEFNNWKSELEQIDDVCIIGIRV